MNCRNVQLVLPEYLVPEIRSSDTDWNQVELHLQACPFCAEQCQQTRLLIELIRMERDVFTEQQVLLQNQEPKGKTSRSGMTTEEGWEDLKRRVPELAKPASRQKILQFPRRIAAVAASVALIMALSWMIFSNSRTQTSTTAVTDPFLPTTLVQLVGPSGKKALPLGQAVSTEDNRQEVLLGNMHRVVMNTETSVSFGAENIGEKVKYNLQLASGELYIEVVSAHQFTVNTPNAKLIITGTRFSVNYHHGQTDLTLVKGSVHFGNSKDQWTDVSAGYASTIAGSTSPTAPSKVDALAATAWARDIALTNALAATEKPVDDDMLVSLRDSWLTPTPDLETIDYDTWTENKRSWFTSQFPWIFKAAKALENQGIDTDYVTLLMISGDIWQFHYPRPLNQPIPQFDPSAIEAVAKYYEIDHKELLETASPSRVPLTALEKTAHEESLGQRYRSAMKLWQSDIASNAGQSYPMPSDMILFTLRAANYLANTRIAAYLWIKTHPEQAEKLSADQQYFSSYLAELFPSQVINHKSWLEFLGEQLTATHNTSAVIQELLTTPRDPGCASQSVQLGQRLANLVANLAAENIDKNISAGKNLE